MLLVQRAGHNFIGNGESQHGTDTAFWTRGVRNCQSRLRWNPTYRDLGHGNEEPSTSIVFQAVLLNRLFVLKRGARQVIGLVAPTCCWSLTTSSG